MKRVHSRDKKLKDHKRTNTSKEIVVQHRTHSYIPSRFFSINSLLAVVHLTFYMVYYARIEADLRASLKITTLRVMLSCL